MATARPLAPAVKPGRPLGLSLAILASAMLFSIIPLVQVAMVVIVQLRLQSRDFTIESEVLGETLTPLIVGGDFTGIPLINLVVQAVLAIGFLIISICTWRGKPRTIRGIFVFAVILLTALGILTSLSSLFDQPNVAQGIDSGGALAQSLACLQLGTGLLIPLYVLWYTNRAPARAFFRGYYLPQNNGDSRG